MSEIQNMVNAAPSEKKEIIDDKLEKLTKEKPTELTESEGKILLDTIKNWSNFSIKRILRNNTMQKLLAVEGTFEGSDDPALIVLEKKSFPECEPEIKAGFFNATTTVAENYHNDIYRKCDIFPQIEFNGLNATVIYPATQKHIEKFEPVDWYIIEETADMYNTITLPQLQAQTFSLQWVDNILDGTAETDRVIYDDKDENTGFVLIKDLKWNDELSALYLIAITRQRIGSIRDLTPEHLPLLKNIKEAGSRAIFGKYGVPEHKLRAFFHYQPSYYHLHVHFAVPEVENAGAILERGHFLSSVIKNIELMPDYYQKATLPFRVCKLAQFEAYKNPATL